MSAGLDRDSRPATAAALAREVRDGTTTAKDVVEVALAAIARANPRINAFTAVFADRARARAAALDAAKAGGAPLGPLAGVPFAVKNLFDVKHVVTTAGSKIERDSAPAAADAPLVARLEAAGAILCGALNMGEYAYDFTGENAHDGAVHNPHDLAHMSGGSSSGSGAAVAAGMVPLALGSDTNGSIRVPASFCGIFGLKPTFGRLPRNGSFPFVASFDHLGPFARSVEDLALAYDAMQGPEAADPACAQRPLEATLPGLDTGVEGLRIAVAGGYFAQGGAPECFAAVAAVAKALGADKTVELPEAARARSAGYLITAAEGAALHMDRLRARPQDFDPDTRDRLFAGALIPAATVLKAQRFRAWFRARVLELFQHVDVVLAPAVPCRAPRIGQKMMQLAGVDTPVRANIGLFTQPISFIGLPVCAVPVWTEGEALPLGVQIIAPPWREDIALRVARALERQGVVGTRDVAP
jgi:aspartyl-tRNA(Asn)/glutamyl-tRNA(Gln) amidotransferase subunit A